MFWLILLIAFAGVFGCLLLWFRDVRRIMVEQKSTVESAAMQLAVYQGKAVKARGDPEAAAVLERSEHIYHQAVDHYNQALRSPWNFLPAHLMGFHCMKRPAGEVTRRESA